MVWYWEVLKNNQMITWLLLVTGALCIDINKEIEMDYLTSQGFFQELRHAKAGAYKGLLILDVRRMHSFDRRFIINGKSIGVHKAIQHLSNREL